MGITNVTPIVSKILTNTDCNSNAHRLLLPRLSILNSPLMSMLTQEEHEAVGDKEKSHWRSLISTGARTKWISSFSRATRNTA